MRPRVLMDPMALRKLGRTTPCTHTVTRNLFDLSVLHFLSRPSIAVILGHAGGHCFFVCPILITWRITNNADDNPLWDTVLIPWSIYSIKNNCWIGNSCVVSWYSPSQEWRFELQSSTFAYNRTMMIPTSSWMLSHSAEKDASSTSAEPFFVQHLFHDKIGIHTM